VTVDASKPPEPNLQLPDRANDVATASDAVNFLLSADRKMH
jgi:hypothetical protein